MKNNLLYKLWFGPIPQQHLKIRNNSPKEYLYKFIIHPIKRRVAKYYLIFLRTFFNLKVVGITGSAGKTTTKEMVTSILRKIGKTTASYANIDPVYNIPSTVLRATPLTRYLILELGVEYPGEMDFYLWLVKPDIGLITNIYPTHTVFFKDILGVAKEKGKLAEALGKANLILLNKENSFLGDISKKTKAQIIWYGRGGMVRAEKIVYNNGLNTEFTLVVKENKITVRLPVLGEAFVSNALGAAAIAFCLGADINQTKAGLEKFDVPEHRMGSHLLKSGAILLDDSYNNNPEAARAALYTLKAVAGKRKMVVVFGDMLELGRLSASAHKELGKAIGAMGTGALIGVGSQSRILVEAAKKDMGETAVWTENAEAALLQLKKILGKEMIILVKGSRSIGLDRLVAKLL